MPRITKSTTSNRSWTSGESDATSKRSDAEQAKSSSGTGPQVSQPSRGACGTSADEIPDDKTTQDKQDHRGRIKKKHSDGRKNKRQKRRQGRVDTETTIESSQTGAEKRTTPQGARSAPQGASGSSVDNSPIERNTRDDNVDKQRKQVYGESSREHGKGPTIAPSFDEGKRSGQTQAQQARTPFPGNKTVLSSSEQKAQAPLRGVLSAKNIFNLKMLKEMEGTDIVQKLNESMPHFKYFLRSEEEQHNRDEFIFDLTCILARVCLKPINEKVINIFTALKGSVFLRSKIPCLLDRIQDSEILNDQGSRRRLIQYLIEIFTQFLMPLPSSYADLPYEQLKRALNETSIDKKEELEKKLEVFKEFRDNIIIAERQKRGQRYTNVIGQKPPNDFRDLPICPTNKEMTSQERPFLRKNISKGRYDDVEHYLDVQFRLLREDFLEPLREGIYEITHNVPRGRRNQSMKCYQGVRVVGKNFTLSGVIYKVQLENSKFAKALLAHSKRLIFGSFVCLSKDNFQTMLFATVANRDPKDVDEGKFDIRFVEGQNVFGIEKLQEQYQMAESPAYFEAYYYVLKGLQELNEKSMPFPKYLVECSAEVDPPEYLRRDSNQDPVCYDLSKTLAVSDPEILQRIPVLEPDAWPSVEAFCLNIFQLEALKTGITTEFSVIQGPPGTGKTYVGAKMAQSLLENRNQWDPEKAFPMLMVCFTNHALDQFLEKVLEFNRERGAIIRVGGRSKSQILEGCNLKQFVKDNRRSDRRGLIHRKINVNLKDMENVKETITKADKELLEFRVLEDSMNALHVDQLYGSLFPPDAITKCQNICNTFKLWLCNDSRLNDVNQPSNGSTKINHADRVDGSILQEKDKSEGEDVPDHFRAPFDMRVTDKPPKQKAGCSREVKREETSNSTEDTTAREDEATRIQNQRRIVGEEEFVSAIRLPNRGNCEGEDSKDENENDEGWIEVKSRQSSKSWRKEGTTLKGKYHTAESKSSRNMETTSERGKIKGKGAAKTNFVPDTSKIQEELQNKKEMSDEEAMKVENIWFLPKKDRLRLYLYWAECYHDRHKMEVQRYERKHEQLCAELEGVRAEEEEEVMRKATVVGMTTSGAARYHSMLQKIGPKIVIIEEAAEVMEAHIITSLSRDTNHVILIGDHKQLRPKATVYELAQKYNLEISLFERMVMNSMDCKRLCIQHRMRPEIAALTKRFYDHEILDHETVCKFENIAGVSQNMFFVDHCEPESLNGNLQSFSNPHEATFLKSLCNYVLQQGYKPHQITILTMYIGQLFLLREQMPRNQFEGIKMCAVDSFQGEENDIILLSLVRSNEEGRIGFLSEPNRICVALSRARKGFYCIGNLNMLRRQSQVWQGICHDLDTTNAIGDTLELTCQRHKHATFVRDSDDFPIHGGCRMTCGERLVCGHACDRPCHPSDEYHDGQCRKVCFKSCPNEHQCKYVCHHPRRCPDCYHGMTKIVPQCGHEQSIPCSVDPVAFSCLVRCEKVLQCGHNCRQKCGEVCTAKCKVKCNKTLQCGHNKELACHRDPTTAECNNECEKILECGHPCKKRCKDECQCNAEIMVRLPCEHMKRVLCHRKHDSYQCTERCRRTLDCGHECSGICYEDCRKDLCNVSVIKKLPCGHQQNEPCHVDPKSAICYARCQRTLDCGHKCSSICGLKCKEVKCEELCQTKCARGHTCQKRCHFGSPCDACMVVVNMSVPTCGHTVEMPCYLDPKSISCSKPCQRSRMCGHSCSSICSKKCEAQPCTELTSRTLPCGHVVVLPCHKNPLKHKCTERIDVDLPCGHKMNCECRVAHGVGKKPLCNEKIEKELPCKHKLTLPCHKQPDGCKCKKKVDVELSCGHTKSFVCFSLKKDLQNVSCGVKTTQKLPCGHKTILPCYINPEEYSCQEKVQLTLSCGHKQLTTCSTKDECNEMVTIKLPCDHEKQMRCSERQNGNLCDALSDHSLLCEEEVQLTLSCGHKILITCSDMRNGLKKDECNEKISIKLPCGHEKKVKCSERKEANIFCNAPCERFLPCEHRCQKKCGDDCASSKCAEEVQKDLSCGFHKVSCLCSENVSQVVCTNRCQRKLPCGHVCPGKCSEKCSQYKCRKKVSKQLNCAGGHSLQMKCSDDPNDVKCEEKCNRKLGCGHLCPGLCSQECKNMRCVQRIEDKLPCGHKLENFRCFQRKTASCTAPCQRQKTSCKHPCKGVCGKDCSNYPCNEVVKKILSCGHNIEMLCRHSIDEVQCPAECKAPLPCDHFCSGTCHDCQERGSHEFCEHQCGRLLICLHRCKAVCGEPCPPCDKNCARSCPHGKCKNRCSQLCDSCTEPCTWNCPHYQCKNLCGEECDRPPCNAPCPKKLPCQHPCIGLCGENCPTLCAICNAKKLSSTLAAGGPAKTEGTRCLQLFDCGHIISVEEMDRWMMRTLVDDVQLLQCPRCSRSITFSYRYGKIIRRTLKNLENVKTQIQQLEAELNKAVIYLSKDIGATQKYDVKHRKKFGQTDLAFARSIPWKWNPFNLPHRNRTIVFKFTFKNHLTILQQVKKTENVLENINACREVSEPSNAIKDALKNIKEDLKNPELDLQMLSQIHEQTKKFFLYSQALHVQVITLMHRISLSSNGVARLRLAHVRFTKFLQGHDDTLDIEWLETIVNLLRTEVKLAPLPKEAQDFANFPGYQREKSEKNIGADRPRQKETLEPTLENDLKPHGMK
ncbi:NFX1-type zinc finger-containing protein 1 [Stylophora pistillata]|uniref:NFX1-type zinc finger-containing protein 1 n=1 Tax=Stylophora pistillata TaxID=50429 RepID=A0A2B4RBC2_STYPI|nr:NFX1-type zinc finger-containing protein 1 [Stylophora pistillata]